MDEKEVLQSVNEIGYLLLRHGAEIYRVEESLQRMCEGLGFKNVEVFAIPSYFTLSLTLHDGTPYHVSKRARSNRIHLDHLYELNCLVRQISNGDIELHNIQEKIEKTDNFKSKIRELIIENPNLIEQRYHNVIEVMLDIKKEFNI